MRTIKTQQLEDKLKQSISIGPHQLMGDVAISLGGSDAGPDPHELVGAGLASCTAITLRMYAKRKNWNLNNVEVQIELIQENSEAAIFKRTIGLVGSLDEEQKKRLLEIANLCPVHKLLSGKILIETALR